MSEQEKEHIHDHHDFFVLKMLVIIVDWDCVQKVEDILCEQLVRFQFVCTGEGTASSEILDVLGVGSMEKGIVLCMQPDFRIHGLMRIMCDKMGLNQPGKGIAFTLPLSGAYNPMRQMFTEEQLGKLAEIMDADAQKRISLIREQIKNKGGSLMEKELKGMHHPEYHHNLIVAVVNQGYSDELMDVAKKAGAGGGTVINARRINAEQVVKFFGISVQAEKEIVIILSKREEKNEIMKAINHDYGRMSEAKGMILSLPVDSIAGLDFE